MNDFDDVTFARFVRRFAEIEHLVQGPPARTFPPMTHRRVGAAALKRTAILIGTVLLLGAALVFAAVGLQPSPTPTPSPAPRVTVPPDSAAPDVVLAAYLSALQARDCEAAEEFVGSVVYRWNDTFCGEWTYITDFRITSDPRWWGINERAIDTVLTIIDPPTGRPAGQFSVTFQLQQQTSGAWRMIDAHPLGPVLPQLTPTPA
jgi:hypothetical protein